MTQSELARKTGIRPNAICDYYNELVDRINLEHFDRINLEHFDRICEVLNCDLSDLLEYVPNKIPKTGKNLIQEEHGNRKNGR